MMKTSECEDRTIKIMQSKQHVENRLKKKVKKTFGAFGTITTDLIFM